MSYSHHETSALNSLERCYSQFFFHCACKALLFVVSNFLNYRFAFNCSFVWVVLMYEIGWLIFMSILVNYVFWLHLSNFIISKSCSKHMALVLYISSITDLFMKKTSGTDVVCKVKHLILKHKSLRKFLICTFLIMLISFHQVKAEKMLRNLLVQFEYFFYKLSISFLISFVGFLSSDSIIK